MKRLKRLLCIFFAVALSLNTGGCSGLGHSDSEVHIAIQPSAAFIPLYIAKEKGWIDEALKEYGVEVVWNKFDSGPPMTDSLLTGDSDIGVIGNIPVVTVCAPGNDVSVIAIAAQAPDSYAILVPSDSDIKQASDLSNKRVAVIYGSTAHNLVEKYLNTGGLSLNDVNLVNITVGDAEPVLRNKQADAVAIWEPSVTRLTADGTVKILTSGSKCGLAGVNGIVARDKYAEKHPEVVTAILTQYKRAADILPTLDDDSLSTLANDLSVTVDQLKLIIPKFTYSVTITEEDLDELNDTIRFLIANKLLRKNYDIHESVNSSFYKGN